VVISVNVVIHFASGLSNFFLFLATVSPQTFSRSLIHLYFFRILVSRLHLKKPLIFLPSILDFHLEQWIIHLLASSSFGLNTYLFFFLTFQQEEVLKHWLLENHKR